MLLLFLRAFADTYDVRTAAREGGEGRSQVGGVFAPLAMKVTAEMRT